MLEALLAFFDEHTELTAASALLGGSVARLNRLTEVIRGSRTIQVSALKGVTTNKTSLREMINSEMKNICLILVPYYTENHNALAKARAMAGAEKFSRSRESDVYELVKAVCDDALKESPAELMKANLTVEEINDLMTMATTYNKLVSGGKVTRETRNLATATIASAIGDARDEVNEKTSGYMRAFRKSHPALVELFDGLCVVDYPHRRHRKPQTTPATAIVTLAFSNEATNEPIEGVVISLNGTVHADPSDESGEIYLDNLAPGTHTVAASAPGYESLEWTTQPLEAGKEYEIEEFLTPEATV